MTIDKIYSDGNLSVRSYNVCKDNGIQNVIDLKEFYERSKSFRFLRNCGPKSNQELLELCDEFNQNSNSISPVLTNESNIVNTIESLSRPQRQVINNFIKITTSNLKVRGQNAIKYYLGKTSPKLNDFVIKIFHTDYFAVSKLKKIGKTTIPEIEAYLNKIKTYINEVSNISNEKRLVSLNNKFLIKHTFSIDEIPNEILENQSIIKLCEFLILKNAFFKSDYTTIFHNTIDVFSSDCKTLEETAIITSLTRERVRQIRERCFVELKSKISFLKNFEDDFHQNYDIDISKNFILLTDEKAEEINFLYGTKISRNFLIYIFSVYLSEQFSINGNLDDVLIPKQFNARNRHNWKNIYIIRKEIKEEIDVNKICEDISSRLLEKINETYKFNFKSYLSRFLITENFNLLENIKDYCEIVINQEFDLFLDLDDNIVFARNTLKTASEFAFDALDALGKPSKVKDIYLKIAELYPGFNTDSNKVRVSLKRKDGFVPIGRTSMFGLRKWENELENFKGGTIRSIVKEYLEKVTTPMHISKITTYVLRYRPKTNENSIIQNLKLDESKMFKFFKNAFIGISGKKYESSFTILSSKSRPIKRTWEESYKMLTHFIALNKRLPLSCNCPESEEILYRWLNNQKNNLNKDKLNLDQTNLINKILKENSSRATIKIDIETKYEILVEFIETHNRLPKRGVEEESKLSSFYHRQVKLFIKNKLNKDRGDKISHIKNNFKIKPKSLVKKINSKEVKYDLLLDFVKSNNGLPPLNNDNYYLNKFFFKQQNQFNDGLLDEAIKKRYLEIKNLLSKNYENTRN
jgi:hypothetical protein